MSAARTGCAPCLLDTLGTSRYHEGLCLGPCGIQSSSDTAGTCAEVMVLQVRRRQGRKHTHQQRRRRPPISRPSPHDFSEKVRPFPWNSSSSVCACPGVHGGPLPSAPAQVQLDSSAVSMLLMERMMGNAHGAHQKKDVAMEMMAVPCAAAEPDVLPCVPMGCVLVVRGRTCLPGTRWIGGILAQQKKELQGSPPGLLLRGPRVPPEVPLGRRRGDELKPRPAMGSAEVGPCSWGGKRWMFWDGCCVPSQETRTGVGEKSLHRKGGERLD
ncbi:uncharacterized protein [Phaenicophaeus curvirostris]|uniref:uncharacterized protein isoform X2 n=1 Tax=Phaenicophaeus curvirostris TaxID=33595 RepID=UPI0037F0A61D